MMLYVWQQVSIFNVLCGIRNEGRFVDTLTIFIRFKTATALDNIYKAFCSHTLTLQLFLLYSLNLLTLKLRFSYAHTHAYTLTPTSLSLSLSLTPYSLTQYGIIIDAGSSHTTLYGYRWRVPTKNNSTGVIDVHEMYSCTKSSESRC